MIPLFLDPAVDNVDENQLNLAYNDQQDDFFDKISSISRICCDGMFAGSRNEDQIRERTVGNYG